MPRKKTSSKKRTRPTKTFPSGQLAVLILAAGEGTRMESKTPKILHPLGGQPVLLHLVRTVLMLKPNATGIVVGSSARQVQQTITSGLTTKNLSFIQQSRPMGSGHAVRESSAFLKRFEEVLILCGDTPLLSFETLFQMLQAHRNQRSQATLLTARLANPRGYGRVVRGPLGDVLKIVEEGDANPKELSVSEINAGAYCFSVSMLLEALTEIQKENAKGEYYLTDVIGLIRARGGRVGTHSASSAEEILGINTRIQLSQAERILSRRTLETLMRSGVTIVDPFQTYVDSTVEVGTDTILWPGTILKGPTKIGPLCQIGPYTYIEDSQIGMESTVRFSMVTQAKLADHVQIGPFAHLRPQTVIGSRAKIGNFTEIKASRIGRGTKVPHLSYVGDAELAEEINVGAGTITCNYDGIEKHKTVIGPGAFIGSNVNLVAPITIGKGASIGAGSTITEDVPADTLAIARARQIHKPKNK